MEGFNGGLKAYWKRRANGHLEPPAAATHRRRRMARAELGGGGGGRRRRRGIWRIRIRTAPKLRALRRQLSPVRILAWIRDAYVRLMLAFARSAAIAGGGGGYYGGELGFPRRPPKEYDEKVLVEIYNSILAKRGAIGAVGPVAGGFVGAGGGNVAVIR